MNNKENKNNKATIQKQNRQRKGKLWNNKNNKITTAKQNRRNKKVKHMETKTKPQQHKQNTNNETQCKRCFCCFVSISWVLVWFGFQTTTDIKEKRFEIKNQR